MKIKYLCFLLLAGSAISGCKKDELVNLPPIVEAGPSKVIILPVNTATLSGSATDADGAVVAYLWSKVSGPNQPVITNPGQATTTVSNLIEGLYKFQLMAVDNDGATGVDTVSVTVQPGTVKNLTLQPGTDGQDALVLAKQGDNVSPAQNFGQLGEVNYSQWTYNSQGFGEGTMRTYIKFTGLSALPAGSQIVSAQLSLYGVATSAFTPPGNSHYPGSSYGSNADNAGYVKRVAGTWDESTITWNNKPGTTDNNQAAIAGTTTQWNNNVTDIDVTDMVKAMIAANSNNGFCLTLQNESIYRNVIFSSSEAADAARRPKLVITYQ
jgi:hypothetical protein